jgi:hypothetical protein
MNVISMRRLLALPTWQLLLLFSLLDLLAVFLYGLYTRGILESSFFHLARERGLGETIQYVKQLFVITMLFKWYKVRPARVLSGWIALFILIVVDDSVGIHEEVGKWIEQVWPFPAVEGLRTKDLAEVVSIIAFEGLTLLYVFWRFIQAPRDLRKVSICLFLALCPLILCSLLLDLLAPPLVEDLGEMISVSILLGCVHRLFRCHVMPGREEIP